MKASFKIKIPKNIQKQATKKTIDGIIDILLRMYQAYKDDCLTNHKIPDEFEWFCLAIIQDTPDEFYDRPIAKERAV